MNENVLNYDLELATKIAKEEDVNLVLVTENYKAFMGHPCTCGYHLDEGDYQLKGRDTDYVNYVCEKCGYELIVYLHKLPTDKVSH